MANVIIKSDERRRHEEFIARTFSDNPNSKEVREMAECASAHINETRKELRRMEDTYGGR